jgi:hypothetical protein
MEWARILAYITKAGDQELLLRNEPSASERTGIRGDWTTGVERGYYFAPFDGFKFEEIRGYSLSASGPSTNHR